jgi:two-component system phosphate regulon sensor histidine kinase PhoR
VIPERRKELSLIVHELRSPVAVVGGYLRLLLQSDLEALSERQRRMLQEANSSCARVFRLIQEINDLAASDDARRDQRLSEIQVFTVCEELLSSTGPQDAQRPVFGCTDGDRPALVAGDAAKLRQAFSALVAAVARERGEIPLEGCGFVHTEDGQRNAVVALGDMGLGSNPQQVLTRRMAFDRWRGGSGLTVPIACHTIEAHGGRVWSFADAATRVVAWSLPLATPSVHS